MYDWCLMRVKFLGENTKKLMFKFGFMAKQDYRMPKKSVGLIMGNKEIELDFVCIITHPNLDLIEYITEVPDVDILITLADYYQVSFELYHSSVNGCNVGYSEYNWETKVYETLELDEVDFYGSVLKDSLWHFEGQVYPNKYSLRKYIWYRKYRNKRIDAILEDIE